MICAFFVKEFGHRETSEKVLAQLINIAQWPPHIDTL